MIIKKCNMNKTSLFNIFIDRKETLDHSGSRTSGPRSKDESTRSKDESKNQYNPSLNCSTSWVSSSRNHRNFKRDTSLTAFLRLKRTHIVKSSVNKLWILSHERINLYLTSFVLMIKIVKGRSIKSCMRGSIGWMMQALLF